VTWLLDGSVDRLSGACIESCDVFGEVLTFYILVYA
jgi:hypothetical protein